MSSFKIEKEKVCTYEMPFKKNDVVEIKTDPYKHFKGVVTRVGIFVTVVLENGVHIRKRDDELKNIN